MRKNKYRNVKVYDNAGKKIADSRKEHRRAQELKLLVKGKIIKDLQEQVRFSLLATFKDNQGNTERGVTYIADFVYFEGKDKIAEDVKSAITKKDTTYIIKRKLFKMTYPEIIFRET